MGYLRAQTVVYRTVECAVVTHGWFFRWRTSSLVKGDECDGEGSDV